MAKGPSDAVVRAAAKNRVQPHDQRDKLVEIQTLGEEAMVLEARIETGEELLKNLKEQLRGIYQDRMPTLMMEARLDKIGIAPKGNSLGRDFELTTVYRASISAEWDDAKRERAFSVLRRMKAEPLIKAEVSASLPKGKLSVAKKIAAFAKKLGVEATLSESVHHGTLSAWLKEVYVAKKKSLPAKDLEAIGGFVGKVAKPVERKE